ncbi:MAG: hypothetical protein ABIC82_03275 [bacterium]
MPSLVKLQTKESLIDVMEAYQTVSKLSEGELETLEILSNHKTKDLIFQSISESKNNEIHSIKSLL